jgi:hypothetical protein
VKELSTVSLSFFLSVIVHVSWVQHTGNISEKIPLRRVLSENLQNSDVYNHLKYLVSAFEGSSQNDRS